MIDEDSSRWGTLLKPREECLVSVNYLFKVFCFIFGFLQFEYDAPGCGWVDICFAGWVFSEHPAFVLWCWTLILWKLSAFILFL